MPTSIDQFPTAPLMEAYRKADAALRMRQAKVCSVLALVLVPACIGLDYFAYPEFLWQMFVGRLLCDLALLPCFLALFSSWGQRHVRLLGNAPPLIPAIAICWMIYATEGVMSPYYAGLNIVMVGVILLIPYTLKEAGFICAVVVVCYVSACVLHRMLPSRGHGQPIPPERARSFLINNVYFLGMTTVIALAACHYTSLRRFQEFRLRYELDANNRELGSTLQKLQDTEVQLVQSEKMNALGKLSAGLLHEINNPLNFTLMALQIADQDAGENAAVRDTLKDIGEGLGRIKTVVSDLRAFAYPSNAMDTEQFSVEEALTSALRMTAHELNGITIDHEQIRGANAAGAKTQIVHVFMNLLVNSAHALQAKPRESAKISISCLSSNDRITVAVRDNGSGVAAADLPKLLDPFFTTKAPGEGMGLGLSICHTIVKNHGGSMRINSELGNWTEVSFDLPMAVALTRSAA